MMSLKMKEKLKRIFRPLLPLWKAWIKFGNVLGVINSFILLTVFYFVVITPIGLVRKLFGRDTFGKVPTDGTTYWQKKEIREQTLENYTRQY